MIQRELERQKAVNHFLNLEISKKQELQDIVELAAKLCGKPTALITLINKDTQFIKFKHDFDFDSTTREDAFCNIVIADSQLLMVPDTLNDERFINNPLVTNDPKIRFYAGAPLITHNSHNLGSLCVVDTEPGSLTLVQQEMLHILAKHAIQLLEFDSRLNILKEQFLSASSEEVKLRAFFDSSASSYLLIDKEYHIIAFNKAVKDFIQQVYGITITIGMDITQFVQEEYMVDFIGYYNRALAGESCHHERLLRFRNTYIFCDLTYNPARNAEGEIIGVSYNSIDITQRKINQEDLVERRSLLEQIAYIQSHELRKPVSNIEGLLSLLEMDGVTATIPELKLMKEAVVKLDKTIALIVNYTTKSII